MWPISGSVLRCYGRGILGAGYWVGLTGAALPPSDGLFRSSFLSPSLRPANQRLDLDLNLDLDSFHSCSCNAIIAALYARTDSTTATASRAQTPNYRQSTRDILSRGPTAPSATESRPLSSGISHGVSSWPADGLIITPFPGHSSFLLELRL